MTAPLPDEAAIAREAVAVGEWLGATGAPSDVIQAQERVARAFQRQQEALREILDYATGWTRPMTPDERLARIERIGNAALRAGGDTAEESA